MGENLTRLVMQTVREVGSYQSFERKVVDFYLMGGRVGRFNHSAKFAYATTCAMYRVIMKRLVDHLHSIYPDTGKPSVFACDANKMTELHRTIGVLLGCRGLATRCYYCPQPLSTYISTYTVYSQYELRAAYISNSHCISQYGL